MLALEEINSKEEKIKEELMLLISKGFSIKQGLTLITRKSIEKEKML